jgi:AraC-like DNA-binding protein
LVFNPYQVHLTKNTHIKSFDYYSLHFDLESLEDINKIFFPNNIIIDHKYYKLFLDLCENLIHDRNKLEIYPLFKKFVQKYAIPQTTNKQHDIIQIVQNYILKNIDENPSLETIALDIGYSKEYIIRLFKKELGITPHAFLLNAKTNKAKKILQNKDKQNLSQIALQSGFYDQSHFVKNFKKSFAITPSQY